MEVVQLDARDTHPLRRRVLREGREDLSVEFPEDGRAGAFHLGVRDDNGALVAVASFSPEESPWRAGRRAYRLRGMAVEHALQGTGAGRVLIGAAVARLREEGVDVLWANARDAALGFYQRIGMEVTGEQFSEGPFALPHHVVVLDL